MVRVDQVKFEAGFLNYFCGEGHKLLSAAHRVKFFQHKIELKLYTKNEQIAVCTGRFLCLLTSAPR